MQFQKRENTTLFHLLKNKVNRMENSKDATKWLQVISTYDNEFKKWEARTSKIVRRYRDDNRSQSDNDTSRFNILWSNIETLVPAVYNRMPKAVARRRFGDNDQVGRVASQIIERALDFEIEHYPDFRASMKNAVYDRFLGGRGVVWVRYEPYLKNQESPAAGLQVTDDTLGYELTPTTPELPENEDSERAEQETPEQEIQEEIDYECTPCDYVHWKDFGHSVARTWEEVTCVWRWVYMSEDALIERFGKEAAKNIPLDSAPENLSGYKNNSQADKDKAKICELWDKDSNKVYWLSRSSAQIIDEREDPLELEGFYPCSMPLYASMTSDSLVPIPDFVLYQDQANDLDILSDRIDGLVKALRVRGVYDASQPALQRLLTEGDNNTLIPVDKWLAFSEKGGLRGSIDLLPIDTMSETLMQCYRASDEIKGQIYEITGISDIIRGVSTASETATAQQIKGQYAGLRLGWMQDEVAIFASELIRLKAQIMCTKYQDKTLLMYSAADQMSDADKQLIPQALELLKTEPLRNFRIEVDSDSLIQLDENQNKADRMEFINTFSGFLSQVLPVAQSIPEIAPMVVELLKFGIGAFKKSEGMEGTLNTMIDQMNQQEQQPQEPPPDPEMMKAQASQQLEQAKMQAAMQSEQMKMQADAQALQMKSQLDSQLQQSKVQAEFQMAQMKAQIEDQKMQHEMAMKQQELAQKDQFERYKAELDATTRIMVAQIGAKATLDEAAQAAEQAAMNEMQSVINKDAATTQMHDLQGQTLNALRGVMETLAKPKQIIRGEDGRAIAVVQ
jgi:hypothetical protein